MQIKKKKSDKGRTTKTSEEEEEEFYDCVLASVRGMTEAAAEDGRLCYSPAFGSILVSIRCLRQVIEPSLLLLLLLFQLLLLLLLWLL